MDKKIFKEFPEMFESIEFTPLEFGKVIAMFAIELERLAEETPKTKKCRVSWKFEINKTKKQKNEEN